MSDGIRWRFATETMTLDGGRVKSAVETVFTFYEGPPSDADPVQDLLAALRRIAAGDPTHSQFAVLAVGEARAAIAKATNE